MAKIICSIVQAGESDAGQIYLLSTVSVGPYGVDIAPPQVKPEPAVQA